MRNPKKHMVNTFAMGNTATLMDCNTDSPPPAASFCNANRNLCTVVPIVLLLLLLLLPLLLLLLNKQNNSTWNSSKTTKRVLDLRPFRERKRESVVCQRNQKTIEDSTSISMCTQIMWCLWFSFLIYSLPLHRNRRSLRERDNHIGKTKNSWINLFNSL